MINGVKEIEPYKIQSLLTPTDPRKNILHLVQVREVAFHPLDLRLLVGFLFNPVDCGLALFFFAVDHYHASPV